MNDNHGGGSSGIPALLYLTSAPVEACSPEALDDLRWQILRDSSEKEHGEAVLSLEDVQRVSADKAAFLKHLLGIAATSEDILDLGAELLAGATGASVVVYGQLPFVLDGGDQVFRVPGWRAGVQVELRFKKVQAAVLSTGHLNQLSGDQSRLEPFAVAFTQVVGVINLWSKRARTHKKYLSCLTSRGLRDLELGRVENWMYMPEC